MLLACTVPAAALGQDNAGVDEYSEQVPGGGGNQPSNPNAGGGGSGGSGDPDGGPLTPAQVAALEAQGADGAAAASLAQQTGPDSTAGRGGAGDGSAGGGGGSAADDGGGLTEIAGNIAGGSDSGMGVALPLILGAALIGALAFVVMRRRGGGQAGNA